jgi:hypothetical protein
MQMIHPRLNWSFVVAFMTIISSCLISTKGQEPKVAAVDRIQLKNGATIQGRILEEKKEDGRMVLVVQLRSGGIVSLDKGKLVERVKTYDTLDAQYERQLAKAKKDDSSDYWKIVKWCEEQPSGKSYFKNERQFLLEKILMLDPNDKDARRKLGYKLENGQWVLEQVWFEAYGYHKKNSRSWISNLPSEFLSRNNEELLQQRRAKIDLWLRRYDEGQVIPEEGRAELMMIADEVTVSILLERSIAADEAKKMLPQRRVFMEVFGLVPNSDSIRALSYFAVQDPDPNIRDRALTLLSQPGFDRELAASMVAGHLRAGNQEFLERAAYVVGELGAIGQFMSLVRALEIKQKVVINPDAGRTNLTNTDGNVGMQTPSKPIIREMLVPSESSLMALKKISNVDYGFDKAAWTQWYLENYTLFDAQVRVDD